MPQLLGEAREGQISVRRSRGINVVEAPIYYTVLCESKQQTRLDVLATPGLPQVGITKSVTLGMCQTKEAIRRVDNPRLWDVVCVFSTEVQEGFATINGQLQQGNPTSWVPIAEKHTETYDKTFIRDYSGNLYVNSLKQPFPDRLTIPIPVSRWEFFQFEPISLNYRQIDERNGITNNAKFLQIDPYKLALTVNHAVVGNWYGFRCWMVEYSIRHILAGQTWKHEVFDVATDGTNLNGSGGVSTTGYPAVLQFDKLKPVDFSIVIRLTEAP